MKIVEVAEGVKKGRLSDQAAAGGATCLRQPDRCTGRVAVTQSLDLLELPVWSAKKILIKRLVSGDALRRAAGAQRCAMTG